MVKRRRKNVVLNVVKIHKIGGYFSTFNNNSGILPLSAHISAETFLLWDPQKTLFPCLYEGVSNYGKGIIPLSFLSTHLYFFGTKHSLKVDILRNSLFVTRELLFSLLILLIPLFQRELTHAWQFSA